jgi:hypothetical protein
MNYTGKVIVSAAGAKLVNGVSSPRTLGMAVVAGTSYSFSYYTLADGSSKAITPVVHWYNFQGVEISTSTASQTSDTSWAKNTLTATAPTAARFATLEFQFGSAATYWLDMLQFAEATVTAFNEARGVTVYLAPTTSIANPYPNKQTKTVRVIEEFYNVLPNNTPYRLELNNTDPVMGFTH